MTNRADANLPMKHKKILNNQTMNIRHLILTLSLVVNSVAMWGASLTATFLDDLSGTEDWTATYYDLDRAQVAHDLGLTEEALLANAGTKVIICSVKEDGTAIAPNGSYASADGNPGDWHDANGHSLGGWSGTPAFYHVIDYKNFRVGIGQNPKAGLAYGQSFSFKLVARYSAGGADPVTATYDVTYKITYQCLYEKAVAEARAALSSDVYASVTGATRATLQQAVENEAEATEAGWQAAAAKIVAARVAFVAAASRVGAYDFSDSPRHGSYACTYFDIGNEAIAAALGLSASDFQAAYKADNTGSVTMATFDVNGNVFQASNDAGDGDFRGYWLNADGMRSGWADGTLFFVYDPLGRVGIGQMPVTEAGKTPCEPGMRYTFHLVFQYQGKQAVVAVTYTTTYRVSYETALSEARALLANDAYALVNGEPRRNLQRLVDADVATGETAWQAAWDELKAAMDAFRQGVTLVGAGSYVLKDSPRHATFACTYLDVDNHAIATALGLDDDAFKAAYRHDNTGTVTMGTYDADGKFFVAANDAAEGDRRGYWLNREGKHAAFSAGYIYFVYDSLGRVGVGQMALSETGKDHVEAGDTCAFSMLFKHEDKIAVVSVTYVATHYLWLQDVLAEARRVRQGITIHYDTTSLDAAIAAGEAMDETASSDAITASVNAINTALDDYRKVLENVSRFAGVVEAAKGERTADAYPGTAAFDQAIQAADNFLAMLRDDPTLDATAATDSLNAAREAYYNSQYPIPAEQQQVSCVDLSLNASEKYVLRVDGQPYYGTNIQLRADKMRGYLGWSDADIEAWFKRAAADGFNTVSVPVFWSEVELEKNHFDWHILDQYLNWCHCYGLRMELLWFSWSSGGRVQWLWNGANGRYQLRTPDYVCSQSGTSEFRVLRNTWEYSLDWRDTNLRERDTYVLSRVMDHVALWDANNGKPHTVVGVQLGNEARGHGNNGATAAEIIDYYHHVGAAVKNSRYVTWTRLNCVSYETSGRTSANEAKRNNGGTNIDFVGIDVYGTNAGKIKGNIDGQLGTNGKNYRMVMEIDAKDAASPFYQMAALAGDKAFDYYNLGPVDGNGLYANDGTSPKERSHIQYVRQRNKILNLAMRDIAVRKQGSGLYVYNCTGGKADTETGYQGIRFTPDAATTQAIAVEHTSNQFLLLSTRGGTFTLPASLNVTLAQRGHFDEEGLWVSEGDVDIVANAIQMPETSCVLCCKNGDVPVTSSVDLQRAERSATVQFYTVDGRRVSSAYKGVKIARRADGTAVKCF